MDTETMIKNLKKVEEDHKDDKVFTGQLNIAEMVHDVRKRLEKLKPYEDTGLTSLEIVELKERDTEKVPEIHKNKFYDIYTCPNCDLAIINKDVAGWFCGKHYSFCPHCGQRLKWED